MKHIVFCPYISSMWASMSQLYAEHVAAGDNVMVMPLPYAVRSPNGMTLEYKTDTDYPVPVIEADAGLLREMHPDTIYFHNPYDGNNLITQVRPEFFSKRLAERTNNLIYVPYYTIPMSSGNDLKRIMTAPGVKRAHRIIVYSEESARAYFSVLGSAWEGRIIVKPRQAPRTDYAMPDEWAEMARDRRLIMLGTSLAALINREDEELDRITKTIMDNQNDLVCLLWRPHPLYEAALTSMLPELRERYHAIVRDFTANNRGILDTSWDVERAVALCSEYIGDASSVVGFFHEQGKPVRLI